MRFSPGPQKSPGMAGFAPLSAACLWGGMYVVSKASFGAIPPITLGLFRLLIGGIALWAVLQASKHWRPQQAHFTRQEKLFLPVIGMTITATLITQFVGTELATAHEGALLTTITPVFIVPCAWLFLRERPHWRVVAGMLVALLGVLLVVGIAEPHGQAFSLVGDALLIISGLCWALFTVLGAPLVRTSSALVVSTYGTLWGIVFLLPFVAWELLLHPLHSLPLSAVGSILYLGIGATALAWFLWYKGVERLPTGVAAIFFFAQPLVGGLLSAVFLHEELGLSFWLGGCVLAVGILLVSR